jgi:hypothetical protein
MGLVVASLYCWVPKASSAIAGLHPRLQFNALSEFERRRSLGNSNSGPLGRAFPSHCRLSRNYPPRSRTESQNIRIDILSLHRPSPAIGQQRSNRSTQRSGEFARRCYPDCRLLLKAGTYQLKLIPLVAPPPPLEPLAVPKITGSSRVPLSVAAQAPSSSDVARTKTAAGKADRAADKCAIVTVVDTPR